MDRDAGAGSLALISKPEANGGSRPLLPSEQSHGYGEGRAHPALTSEVNQFCEGCLGV